MHRISLARIPLFSAVHAVRRQGVWAGARMLQPHARQDTARPGARRFTAPCIEKAVLQGYVSALRLPLRTGVLTAGGGLCARAQLHALPPDVQFALIDVRTREEVVQTGMLAANAVNVPLDELERALQMDGTEFEQRYE